MPSNDPSVDYPSSSEPRPEQPAAGETRPAFLAREQWLDRLGAWLERNARPVAERPLRVGILGALGTGDVGDEAMLVSLREEIKAIRADTSFTVFSIHPETTTGYTGIPCRPTAHAWYAPRRNVLAAVAAVADRIEAGLTAAVPALRGRAEIDRGQWMLRLAFLAVLARARRLARRLDARGTLNGEGALAAHVRDVRELDLLIYLGGGYLNSWHVKADTYLYLLSAVVATELGIPVAGSGMNLGPFNEFDARRVGEILRDFSLVGLRDRRESVQALESMGLCTADRHGYSGDDAIRLAPEASPELERWAAEHTPYIALHAHYWRLSPADWRQFSAKLAKAVDAVVERSGLPVVMLPMTFGPSHELFDVRALRDIAGQCVNSDRIVSPPGELTSGQLRYLYGLASSAIVCRHHAMVFSLAAGVPTTALYFDRYYRQKILGVSEPFGDLCAPLDATTCSAQDIEQSVLRRLPGSVIIDSV